MKILDSIKNFFNKFLKNKKKEDQCCCYETKKIEERLSEVNKIKEEVKQIDVKSEPMVEEVKPIKEEVKKEVVKKPTKKKVENTETTNKPVTKPKPKSKPKTPKKDEK